MGYEAQTPYEGGQHSSGSYRPIVGVESEQDKLHINKEWKWRLERQEHAKCHKTCDRSSGGFDNFA